MTPADGDAQRLAARGWTLARVEGVSFGEGTTQGWRATKGRYVRGGARLEAVVEQVEEHERWERAQMQYIPNEIVTGDARALAPSIANNSVDLVFTDPVYERIEDYRWLAEEAARVLKPGGVLLVFIGVNYLEAVVSAMRGPLTFRGMLTWNLKGPGNKRYGKTIDNGAWLLWYGGWPVNFSPLVWDSLPSNERVFKWQKSPALTARHVSDFTLPGAVVWEPFAGGGTVPAVCKMLGRTFLASEIDPDTAARARERVANTQPPLPGLVVEQMPLEPAA